MERTFVMIKPDGVQRGLMAEVMRRFEKRGFKIVACKLMTISNQLAQEHYAEHQGKPFFEDLIKYITSGPVLTIVLEGDYVIASVRRMMGATDPQDAVPGTIRGDLAITINQNVIHGSDSRASADREIGLFFSPGDINEYSKVDEKWIYS
jgi:nucleoside-diphosphate kinase